LNTQINCLQNTKQELNDDKNSLLDKIRALEEKNRVYELWFEKRQFDLQQALEDFS
jgi:hypothetical protein